MPYASVKDLPPAVQKLPTKRARQWMHVWNSAFESCTASGGSKCEESAFAQAWGTVKKDAMEEDGIEMPEPECEGCPFAEECISTAPLDKGCKKLIKAYEELEALPDSSFAVIQYEGEGESAEKTRYFPLQTEYQVKAALAKMNTAPFGNNAKPKILSAAKRFGIKLDEEKYKSDDTKVETLIKIAGQLEKGIVYGVVYEPDSVDTQGDFASAEEIERAAHDFLPNAVMNLNHSEDLQDVQVVESYIAPCDFFIGQNMIRKGSWVLVTKILDEDLKDAILKGEINAYSLEGTATRFNY